MFKRIFLLVLDGLGVGYEENDNNYTNNANTLLHTIGSSYNLDVLETLGLTSLVKEEYTQTRGLYMKCKPMNIYKDSLNAHYEIMCSFIKKPYLTYPDGFPLELISKIKQVTGYDIIGNVNMSTDKIINELGEMHIKTKSLIVYTSDDSILEVAAHEDIVPLQELYEICNKISEIVSSDEYRVSRVIAVPFTGKHEFTQLSRRKDFVLDPPINALDLLEKNRVNVIGIGKVNDMFNDKCIGVKIKTHDNIDTMLKVVDFSKGNFNGLLFANLNDFNNYGIKRDKTSYKEALEEFNYYLPILIKNLHKDDLLIITSDHGCDPTLEGFDHSREMLPILIYNPMFKKGKHLNNRETLADIGATILDAFNIKNELGVGTSIFDELRK